jgi:hypothetical protein
MNNPKFDGILPSELWVIYGVRKSEVDLSDILSLSKKFSKKEIRQLLAAGAP